MTSCFKGAKGRSNLLCPASKIMDHVEMLPTVQLEFAVGGGSPKRSSDGLEAHVGTSRLPEELG